MIQKFVETMKNITTDTSGAAMVEYALIIAVIALIVIASAVLFGENLLTIYESFSL